MRTLFVNSFNRDAPDKDLPDSRNNQTNLDIRSPVLARYPAVMSGIYGRYPAVVSGNPPDIRYCTPYFQQLNNFLILITKSDFEKSEKYFAKFEFFCLNLFSSLEKLLNESMMRI